MAPGGHLPRMIMAGTSPFEPGLLAVDEDLTGVALVGAAEDLDEAGLARAIAAEQADHHPLEKPSRGPDELNRRT
jgi:hypothetical protein